METKIKQMKTLVEPHPNINLKKNAQPTVRTETYSSLLWSCGRQYFVEVLLSTGTDSTNPGCLLRSCSMH